MWKRIRLKVRWRLREAAQWAVKRLSGPPGEPIWEAHQRWVEHRIDVVDSIYVDIMRPDALGNEPMIYLCYDDPQDVFERFLIRRGEIEALIEGLQRTAVYLDREEGQG